MDNIRNQTLLTDSQLNSLALHILEYYKDGIDYWDEPWEIEAHGRETGLFVRWAEKHKLGKRKWTQDPGGAEARS